MNVLKPISTPQQLIFIPRNEVSTISLWLLNELTEESITLNLPATYLDGYMKVEITHDFNEGENYSYDVKDNDGNLLYRGKIFITAQTDLQNYDLLRF